MILPITPVVGGLSFGNEFSKVEGSIADWP